MNKNILLVVILIAIAAVALYAVTGMSGPEQAPIVTPTPTSTQPAPEPTPSPIRRSRTVTTQYGDLLLAVHNDGTARLTGELFRSTPCISWDGDVISTLSFPPTDVNFSFTRAETAEVCIQVLGEPYTVNLMSSSGPDTTFAVSINGETIWSGKM